MLDCVLNHTHALALVRVVEIVVENATKFVKVNRSLSLCFPGEYFSLSFLSYCLPWFLVYVFTLHIYIFN